MLKIEQITTELCKRRMVDVLRDYVGPGKKWDYESGGEALGIEYRTLSSYALGENLPTLPKLLRMFRLFGPGFANRVLHLAGLGGCYRQEVQEVSDLNLNANTAKLIGALGEALRDGRIDARERPEILRTMRLLFDDMQNWMAEHDRMPEEALGADGIDRVNARPRPRRCDA